MTVFVHLGAVLGIMVPSFAVVLSDIVFVNPTSLTSILSLAHVATGAAALTLGIWFVGSWRFRKNFQGCFKKRKPMPSHLNYMEFRAHYWNRPLHRIKLDNTFRLKLNDLGRYGLFCNF